MANPRVAAVTTETWRVNDGNSEPVSTILFGKVDDIKIQMVTFRFGVMTTDIG
jgi:hypothetical protein